MQRQVSSITVKSTVRSTVGFVVGFVVRSTVRFIIVATVVLTAACSGGLRPTLVQDGSPTPEPPLQLDVPAAPEGTAPLPQGSPDLNWEASVDDALFTWAKNRNVPYLDSCRLVTPGPGEYCDNPTERDTVRLLGPSATEMWYVVTVEQQSGLDFGTGYRVSTVTILGS